VVSLAAALRVHTKEQVADAWAFRDRRLLRDYLDGKVTELDYFITASRTATPRLTSNRNDRIPMQNEVVYQFELLKKMKHGIAFYFEQRQVPKSGLAFNLLNREWDSSFRSDLKSALR
jgi:hypothetical protein